MKLKLLIASAAIAASCVVLHDEPQIDANPSKIEIASKTKQDEPLVENPVLNNTAFVVNVEFMVYARQVEKYPAVMEAFLKALNEWTSHIPVRATVYVEDPNIMTYMGPMICHDRPGIIQVVILDVNSPTLNFPEGIVGMWAGDQNQLLLDSDSLQANPDVAYAVCLHELGHLFGVPHIVGPTDNALTGYVIVPENANQYVMFPEYAGVAQNVLSPIEIQLAIDHVLHSLTDPNKFMTGISCIEKL